MSKSRSGLGRRTNTKQKGSFPSLDKVWQLIHIKQVHYKSANKQLKHKRDQALACTFLTGLRIGEIFGGPRQKKNRKTGKVKHWTEEGLKRSHYSVHPKLGAGLYNVQTEKGSGIRDVLLPETGRFALFYKVLREWIEDYVPDQPDAYIFPAFAGFSGEPRWDKSLSISRARIILATLTNHELYPHLLRGVTDSEVLSQFEAKGGDIIDAARYLKVKPNNLMVYKRTTVQQLDALSS